MEFLSIRELRRQTAGSGKPVSARLQVQLEQRLEKTTKQGKRYQHLAFTDGLEPLTLRVWEDHPMHSQASELPASTFLELSGQWIHRDPFGIEPETWHFRFLEEKETEEMLAGPQEIRSRQAKDLQSIEAMVTEMRDPRLRLLCERFLQNYRQRLQRTAAARQNHHAWRGGLIEHVAQMMRAAKALSAVYHQINADLLLAGTLFHDCGKLWENAYRPQGFEMPHREVSELLGHIPLGIELVNRLWNDIHAEHEEEWKELTPNSAQVRLHLLHLIASHHGTPEFGSPVYPKTPEALLLHFIDNIDAKLEMLYETYEKGTPLSNTVFKRVRPLPANTVSPLPRFEKTQ